MSAPVPDHSFDWRAITIQEPWASMIVNSTHGVYPRKLVENRANDTADRYRGHEWLAIHASKQFDTNAHNQYVPKELFDANLYNDTVGKIIGFAHVKGIIPSTEASDDDLYVFFSDDSSLKKCIVFDQVFKLMHPINAVGQTAPWYIVKQMGSFVEFKSALDTYQYYQTYPEPEGGPDEEEKVVVPDIDEPYYPGRPSSEYVASPFKVYPSDWPLNNANGCYIDSLLVALLAPSNTYLAGAFLYSRIRETRPNKFVFRRTRTSQDKTRAEYDADRRRDIQSYISAIAHRMRGIGWSNAPGQFSDRISGKDPIDVSDFTTSQLVTKLRKQLGRTAVHADKNFCANRQRTSMTVLMYLLEILQLDGYARSVHKRVLTNDMATPAYELLDNVQPYLVERTSIATDTDVRFLPAPATSSDLLTTLLDNTNANYRGEDGIVYKRRVQSTRYTPTDVWIAGVERGNEVDQAGYSRTHEYNLRPHVFNFSQDVIIGPTKILELYSIVCYANRHYTAFFRGARGWMKYDDTRRSMPVWPVTFRQVRYEASRQGVMFIYANGAHTRKPSTPLRDTLRRMVK